jgi:hypothetical protein
MAKILVAFSVLISAVVLGAASHPIPKKTASRCVRHSVMASQSAIPQSVQERTMRPYLKAAGMAFGLVAVWAALVQVAA